MTPRSASTPTTTSTVPATSTAALYAPLEPRARAGSSLHAAGAADHVGRVELLAALSHLVTVRDERGRLLKPNVLRLAALLALHGAHLREVPLSQAQAWMILGDDGSVGDHQHARVVGDAARRSGSLITTRYLNPETGQTRGPGAIAHWRLHLPEDRVPSRVGGWEHAERVARGAALDGARLGRTAASLIRLAFAVGSDGVWMGDRDELAEVTGLDRKTAREHLEALDAAEGGGLTARSELIEVETPAGIRRKLRFTVRCTAPGDHAARFSSLCAASVAPLVGGTAR